MMTDDQSRSFCAQTHARHPRVTICVGEINVPSNENVLIIRAPRCQNQYAQHCNLDDGQPDVRDSLHTSIIANRKSKIRSEEHTSELQSPMYLVCRLLLEKKKNNEN